ncbi:MAG: class I adenylate-forming enzyme family protein [Solirubrobacteraceae bacterium]
MQFLLDRFAEAGDRAAFVADGRTVTYADVSARVDVERARLAHAGVAPGEVAVIVADYSPEVFCLILALAGNGNVIAPLTPQSVVERDVILGLAEASWVIDCSDGEPTFASLGHVEAEAPLLRELVATGRPGLLLFSSGSTGTPKAILHDFERVAAKFEQPRRAQVAICFLMLDHFGGINTLLAITSSLGAVVTVSDRSVKGVCGAIETNGVELLPTTPSFLNMLVRSDAHHKHDLSSLKTISYGTEVMPQPTLDRLGEAFPGVKLQQTYGLSELGVLRSQSRPDGSLWVRIGGDGFELKVVDDVLWIRSAFSMLGYLNAPSPFDDEGWFCTQDKVEVDGEWLRILGRTTDLINVGGQKVYPAEVEDVILELDGVQDVAVHAEAHNLLGAIIVARVTTTTGESQSELKRRVRRHCAARLAPFKVPTKVEPTEEGLYSNRMKKLRGAA